MNAVNLIPRDARGGSGGTLSAASGGTYALLGGLAVLVAATAAMTLAGNQVDDRQAELNRVNAQAQAAESRVTVSSPYDDFAEMAKARVGTVTSLSAERFDYEQTMGEISRTLPAGTYLEAMKATTTPEGADPAAAAAATSPSVELTGCTSDNIGVANVLTRLRAVTGSPTIALKTADQAEDNAGEDGCGKARATDIKFVVTMTFAAKGGATAAPAPGSAGTTTPPAAPGATTPPAAPGASATPPAGNAPAAPATPNAPATPTGVQTQ